MALTGMAIYKLLPKKNCGDCGVPTCMAFAMQVAAKQKSIEDCPHISEEAKAELSSSTGPAMRLVRIGTGNACVEIGQETVMFRHEEKFHRKPALAVKISPVYDNFDKKLEAIRNIKFERTGEILNIRIIALDLDGINNSSDAVSFAKKITDSGIPLILIGKNYDTLHAAAKAVSNNKPLIYSPSGFDDRLVDIGVDVKSPLAIFSSELETLVDLTQKARAKGVEDIVLAFDGHKPVETLHNITIARRAALKKLFRPLGYPCMVDVSCDDATEEMLLASFFAAKYAGIILIKNVDPTAILPVLTVIQNIYTDPQKPNTVEPKLYAIGNVDENSPVMFTTNFALTYYSVAGEVERSKVPAYICVVDTEGLGVLNAYAGDKISPEKVVKTLQEQKVAEKVKHRKLIIPGLLPSFRAEIEEISEWKEVIIGPEQASGLPAFLKKWKP